MCLYFRFEPKIMLTICLCVNNAPFTYLSYVPNVKILKNVYILDVVLIHSYCVIDQYSRESSYLIFLVQYSMYEDAKLELNKNSVLCKSINSNLNLSIPIFISVYQYRHFSLKCTAYASIIFILKMNFILNKLMGYTFIKVNRECPSAYL